MSQNSSSEITPREAYDRLLDISREIAYIDSMIRLSLWDQNLMMPERGTAYRAKAQAYLSDLKNKKLIDPEFGRLLSIAETDANKSLVEPANLRLWRRD